MVFSYEYSSQAAWAEAHPTELSEFINRKQANHDGEEGKTFDQGRGDNHTRKNTAASLRLTSNALDGSTGDMTNALSRTGNYQCHPQRSAQDSQALIAKNLKSLCQHITIKHFLTSKSYYLPQQ
jgi:hypothetical protein